MTTLTRIEMLFQGASRQGRKMLTHAEIETVATIQGVTPRQLAAAIRAGDLRVGIDGYWLPEAPDPGAMAVMRAAMRETSVAEELS